jgi:hypothetical protein
MMGGSGSVKIMTDPDPQHCLTPLHFILIIKNSRDKTPVVRTQEDIMAEWLNEKKTEKISCFSEMA